MSDTRKKTKNPDRLPPHSEEAERMVLGTVFDSPVDGMIAMEQAGVKSEWFYSLPHQVIWKAIVAQSKAGAVDLVSVIVRLKDEGIIEQVGGLDYVQRLTDGVPGIGFLEQYLGIVLEKYRLRAALKAAATLAHAVYELEGTSEELLADAEETITELQLAGGTKREVALNQVISPVVQELFNYHRGGAQMHGLLNTGIDYTDKFLGGLGGRNGNYIVISARPGLGKTSIATQIALHAALDFEWWEPVLENGKPVMEMGAEDEERPKVIHRKGVPVAIFSLEMATDALVHRMLFQRARADMQRWRTGFAEKGDIEPIEVAAEEFLATNNIWIDDEGRSTIDS